MVNIDVLKDMIKEDLESIAKAKLDILILQRENENLCKKNNEKIEKLTNFIKNTEISLEESLAKSGERKIETPAGWCSFRAMPDKWEYEDSEIINWCKNKNMPYYHTVEIVEKMKLKKAIQSGKLKLDDVPGLTITPQEPKFGYKLKEK